MAGVAHAANTAFIMDVPTELTRQDVKFAIGQAARARKWNVVETTEDTIHIHLTHRKVDANLYFSLVEAGNHFRIEAVSDSWRLDRKGNRQDREDPHGWIENIRKDLSLKMLAVQHQRTAPEWQPLEMSSDELREIFINESSLIDPFSAQFRKVVQQKDNPQVICGQLNSKNRMGAYTGWSLFYVDGKKVHVLGSEPTAADLALVGARCRGSGELRNTRS